MTDTATPVQASATALVVTVVRPTTGLVREYLKAKGAIAAESRKTITVEDKVEFLIDFPETARALARDLGLTIGNRGVIAKSVFVTVAESL